MQIILDGTRRDTLFAHDQIDRLDGILGQLAHGTTKALDSHHLGITVMAHRLAPGRIRSQAPRRQTPDGLTLIEISCAPLRNLVDHEGRARGLLVAGRERIEHFRDRCHNCTRTGLDRHVLNQRFAKRSNRTRYAPIGRRRSEGGR